MTLPQGDDKKKQLASIWTQHRAGIHPKPLPSPRIQVDTNSISHWPQVLSLCMGASGIARWIFTPYVRVLIAFKYTISISHCAQCRVLMLHLRETVAPDFMPWQVLHWLKPAGRCLQIVACAQCRHLRHCVALLHLLAATHTFHS